MVCMLLLALELMRSVHQHLQSLPANHLLVCQQRIRAHGLYTAPGAVLLATIDY